VSGVGTYISDITVQLYMLGAWTFPISQVELSSANAQRELAYSPGKEGLMEVSVVVEKSCDGMVDSMMVDTHFESSTSAQTELAHAVDATDLVAELQSNAS